jgi:SAM-dependent methyltransferase
VDNSSKSESGLEYYEQVCYSYQTVGRGVLTAPDLERTFERMALSYDETVGPFLPADRATPCLDLACGYGNWLYYLRKKGFTNMRGLDLDPKQVELAKALNLPAEIGDIRDALTGASTFGLISAFDLIEHLEKSTAVRMLQQIHASLLPGGVLILQCPCADGFTGAHDICNDMTHKWGASSNMLNGLLRAVGFGEVRIIDTSMAPFPQGAKRKFLRLIRKLVRAGLQITLRAGGVKPPAVWSNSQIAVAWKAK